MRYQLFRCIGYFLASLLVGGVMAAETLSPAELSMQVKPARVLGGHLAFRAEHCRVLVLQADIGCVLLVLPESPEHAVRVKRVVERLSKLLFAGQDESPESLTAGDGRLVFLSSSGKQTDEADCLGRSGVQALITLLKSGEFRQVSLNDRGRLVLSLSSDGGPGVLFYPAVARLDVLEVVGKLSGRKEALRIADILGYGEDASRSTRERLSRNLKCQVLFYNSDDEALMAERGGKIYVGQRDAVRKLMEGGKAPRAVLRFPEEMAALPELPKPPPPPMPGAAEALDAYLKYLRSL